MGRTFTYTGKSEQLMLKGKALRRGIPTELPAGAAADMASRHRDVVTGEPVRTPSPTSTAVVTTGPTAFEERRALVARAKELGIPAKGSTAELKAKVEAAEAGQDG